MSLVSCCTSCAANPPDYLPLGPNAPRRPTDGGGCADAGPLSLPLQVLHWPSVFHIFGSLGVAWWALWEWRAASSPDDDPLCSESERSLLASTTVKRVCSLSAFLPMR